MSDTNEAHDTQVQDVPETAADRARATLEAVASEGQPIVQGETAPVVQAEEVATSDAKATEATDPTPEAKTVEGGDAAQEVETPDLGYLPDDYRERLLASYNKDTNTFTIPAEDFLGTGELRSGWMRKKGFHDGMRKNSEVSKENAALIRDGENFRKLFEDESEQAAFLRYKEEQKSRAAAQEVPEFSSDAEMVEYAAQRAKAELKAEFESARDAEQRQAAEAEALVETFTGIAGEAQRLTGLSDAEFEQACAVLNEQIRARGEKPWEVLTDPTVFADALGGPLQKVRESSELVRLREKLAALENEQSKSAAARSAAASSPRGISTVTKDEYPDTPEGRARATLEAYRASLG